MMCAVSLQNYAVSSAPDVPTAKRWNRIGAILLSGSFACLQLLVPAAVVYSKRAALMRARVRSAKHTKGEARRRQDALKYRQATNERRMSASIRVQLVETAAAGGTPPPADRHV